MGECVGSVTVFGSEGVECGGLGGGVCGECDGFGESGSEVWRTRWGSVWGVWEWSVED